MERVKFSKEGVISVAQVRGIVHERNKYYRALIQIQTIAKLEPSGSDAESIAEICTHALKKAMPPRMKEPFTGQENIRERR